MKLDFIYLLSKVFFLNCLLKYSSLSILMNTTSMSYRISKRLTDYKNFETRIDTCLPYRYGVSNDTYNFYSMIYLQRSVFTSKQFIYNLINDPEFSNILSNQAMCNFYTLMIMQQKK